MNRIILVVIGILIVFAGVIGLARRQGAPQASTTPPYQATLTVLQPDVMVKRNRQENFQTLDHQMIINAGDEIKTSANGRAQLTYPNGTVTRIDEDSYLRVQILDTNGSQSRINLLAGEILSKIKNILGTGNYYEIQTDTVVASVRGTVFRTEFRNNIARIYGIEHQVHVHAVDKKTQKGIPGTDIDINSGEKTEVDVVALAATPHALQKQLIETTDLQQKPHLRRHLQELDDADRQDPQIKHLLERLKLLVTPTPTASKSPTPKPSPSLSVSPLPSEIIIPTSTPTATPSQTPPLNPALDYIFPRTVSAGAQFTINGSNFIIGSNKQISAVFIGQLPVAFNTIDSTTIFANAPQSAGVYDISLTTSAGSTLLLPRALTVQ